MMEGTIVPELSALVGPTSLVSRTLRSYGVAESRISELLDDLFHASSNPTIAYLAGGGEVHVRLTAACAVAEAAALLDPLERRVRERLGDHVYGSGDDSLEVVAGRLLDERVDDRLRRVADGRRARGAHHVRARRLLVLPRLGRHVLDRGETLDPRGVGVHARRTRTRQPRVRHRDGIGRRRRSVPTWRSRSRARRAPRRTVARSPARCGSRWMPATPGTSTGSGGRTIESSSGASPSWRRSTSSGGSCSACRFRIDGSGPRLASGGQTLRLFVAVEVPEDVRAASRKRWRASVSGSRRRGGCRHRTNT